MFAYSADQIRAAEKALMAHEVADDEMMKLAAAAVADTALDMLRAQSSDKVVVVAGPGGNGGDGLFAATHLLLAGYRVHAVPVATLADGSPKVHEAAWHAFRAAGGELLGTGELAELADSAQAPALIIDAIAGLSAGRGLDGAIAEFFHAQRRLGTDVLTVDVPTGVHCDTGETAPETAAREAPSTAADTDQDAGTCERQPGDSYVRATVTISFGAGRLAHAATPACGKVVIADLQLPNGPRSFAEELAHQNPIGQTDAIAHEDGEHGEDEHHVTEFFQVPAIATRTQIQARA